jgi:hypothetical protein
MTIKMLGMTGAKGQIARNQIRDEAREGARVRIGVAPGVLSALKTAWAGLGNRAGLHSYADTLLNQKWEKSGARFMKKLEALPAGTVVQVYHYRALNRDRGSWRIARSYVL